MHLPRPRGPLSELLLTELQAPPHAFEFPPSDDDPLTGDDHHLALYLCYELHYRGLPGVDDRWEWEPSLIAFTRSLEQAFEGALRDRVHVTGAAPDIPARLKEIVASDPGPFVSDYLQDHATLEQFKEFVVHRSAYHLKEADPHSWAIPRLAGRPKAALVEIQADEYGSGSAERMHSKLFASAMEALGLDSMYGAYLDAIPGVTLATVNLMSMFGIHRRLRGALVGHLAVFEMTSPVPNRKFANGLRRLGAHDATPFYDEHVEADAVHEVIASHDMARGLAEDDPAVANDILFGAQALVDLDAAFARHLLESWRDGRSSLCGVEVPALQA